MIPHRSAGRRAVVASIFFGLATLCAFQARANESIFDMDPACAPIAAATKGLSSLTDYAEWPTKIQNAQIKPADWQAAPYLDHLDVIAAWAQAASRTRSESWKALYRTLITELTSGAATLSDTMVILSPDDKASIRIYGIERPAIGRGPISKRPTPNFDRRYRLWSFIVEDDRTHKPDYIPISTESDGSDIVIVNSRPVLLIPSLASAFSLSDSYPSGIATVSICPSLRNKNGALK